MKNKILLGVVFILILTIIFLPKEIKKASIKGVNVFPSQIEEILRQFPEVSSEYQIRISHLDGKDTLRIYVETNGSVDFLELSDHIAATVKSKIGFTPLVKVVELGVLPRSEKKSKRVIDERYE